MNWIKRKLRDWVAPKYEYWHNRAHELSRENTELKIDIYKLVTQKNKMPAMEVEIKWSYLYKREEVFSYGSIKGKEFISEEGLTSIISDELFDNNETI